MGRVAKATRPFFIQANRGLAISSVGTSIACPVCEAYDRLRQQTILHRIDHCIWIENHNLPSANVAVPATRTSNACPYGVERHAPTTPDLETWRSYERRGTEARAHRCAARYPACHSERSAAESKNPHLPSKSSPLGGAHTGDEGRRTGVRAHRCAPLRPGNHFSIRRSSYSVRRIEKYRKFLILTSYFSASPSTYSFGYLVRSMRIRRIPIVTEISRKPRTGIQAGAEPKWS